MQLFFAAIGCSLLFLALCASHEHGRKTEEQYRRAAEEYAAKCVREYHEYNQRCYLQTEAYRRWQYNLPQPQLYPMSEPAQHRRREVVSEEFASRYQQNGQATMMVQNGRSN